MFRIILPYKWDIPIILISVDFGGKEKVGTGFLKWHLSGVVGLPP